MDAPRSDQGVAEAILSYLAEHPQAMDTAEGITQWWIMRQQVRVTVTAVTRVFAELSQQGMLEELGDAEHRRYRLKRRRRDHCQLPGLCRREARLQASRGVRGGGVTSPTSLRPDVCPTGALTPPRLTWPRSVRATFSDPTITHPSTGTRGGGTEEIKSNDVTGRLKPGEIGVVVELGRPGLGARLRDLQTVAMALAEAGARFEPNNPVTHLMTDTMKGTLQEEVLNEKVLSAIIECRTDAAQTPRLLAALRRMAAEIETVFSAGIAARCGLDGAIPYEAVARESGFGLSLNAKTNLGLGRPLFEEAPRSAVASAGRA